MRSHGSMKLSSRQKTTLLIPLAVSLVAGAIASWIYMIPPLEDYTNSIVIDGLTLLVALGAAIAGILLVTRFAPDEKPRLIWFWFAMGWVSWTLGEVATAAYDIFKISYTDFSVFDAFWVLGYICFGLALFLQYRRIYSQGGHQKMAIYLAVVVFALLVTAGLTQLALHTGLGTGKSWIALYITIFYPVGDIFIGIPAIWLSLVFGRGSWGRPWWALIVFAISDGINTYQWIGGYNGLSATVVDVLNWIQNITYYGGYALGMFGLLSILIYYIGAGSAGKSGAGSLPA